MSSAPDLDSRLTQALAAVSVSLTVISHAPASTPAEWRSAIEAHADAPKDTKIELIKTLIFKPKTAKSAVAVPVLVVAREEAETNAAAVAKLLGVKEVRLANEELLREVFGLDKDSLSPLTIDAAIFSKITTVLDPSISESSSTFALRASSPSTTLFVSGAAIAAHLRGLETDEVKITDLQVVSVESGGISSGGAPAAAKEKAAKEDAKIDGAVQVAIGVKKEVDFAAWYTSVLLKSDMMDYYNVSGCYILRPWSYSIWESIQDFFNTRIKALGVQNSYFPMFVSRGVLEREKNHVEGFSPEVAWVTRAGQSDLEEPIAIRPTSETAMYPYYAKWIRSHRDLPLKLNQWNSVVRWEFKNPQPFIRTREFLWQEGHTAFLTKPEADAEVRQILDLYRQVYEDLLAVPVIPGIKSEKEKFAGGLYTTTLEGFVPTSGRGIQAATSHCLGQNFSRPEMFNIFVEDPADKTKGKSYVWQNSWGLSTRAIGVMVMVHGDNQGLVLPPRVASVQVVVVPCGVTARTGEEERRRIGEGCEALAERLRSVGVRAKADLREGYTPGWKFNEWEQKGVPLRLEIGPNDLAKSSTLSVRRDTGTKAPLPLSDITTTVPALLEAIQSDMFEKARSVYWEHVVPVSEWDEVVPALDAKNVVVMPWCEEEACEEGVKERSGRAAEPQDERAPSAGAKSLCIPFDQGRWPAIEPGKTKCVGCGKDAKRWTLFGRSY